MQFTKAIALALDEVPKADLIAGQKYLMLDDKHVIVVLISTIDGRKFATVELSYLAVRLEIERDIVLDHFTNELAKFFRLPA